MHNNSAGTVHWHRHDVSTILWHCPITSMTRTLSSWCSNRTGDNRARSRILWLFWFVMELFAAPEENRHWTGPHTVLGVERPSGNFYTFNVQDLELVPDVQYLALIVEKSSRNPHSQGWRSQGKDRLQRNQHHPCNCTRIWATITAAWFPNTDSILPWPILTLFYAYMSFWFPFQAQLHILCLQVPHSLRYSGLFLSYIFEFCISPEDEG